MTINELKGISPIKPIAAITPDRARIDLLKRNKDAASKRLELERDRQKLAKAQKNLRSVTSTIAKP